MVLAPPLPEVNEGTHISSYPFGRYRALPFVEGWLRDFPWKRVSLSFTHEYKLKPTVLKVVLRPGVTASPGNLLKLPVGGFHPDLLN